MTATTNQTESQRLFHTALLKHKVTRFNTH